MANPYITRAQLAEAVEHLPNPEGALGRRCVVEVASLEHQDIRVRNDVVPMVKLEAIEFELVEFSHAGSKATPMWKFFGDIHLNEHDEHDTDLLELFMETMLGAKDMKLHKHTAERATVTALFRPKIAPAVV
jgi:hypothetical protein